MLNMKTELHQIKDKEFGTIVFHKNERAKRLSVRILNDALRVTLPSGYSIQDAVDFIQSNREKIVKTQSKITQQSILITMEKPLETLTFKVVIKPAERKDIFSSLKSGILSIEFPKQLSVNDERTQQYFWNSITYFMRAEAKRLLPARTAALARKFGFRFTDVKIQSAKTRWGSCNQQKNINLSLYLMLLPQHLIDYIILHELCHTREMNHGVRFWKLMDEVTGGQSDALRSELKSYVIPK